MQQQTKQTYEFGPFRLDPVQRVLLKDGETVPLTPKAFDVLLLLVESHGHIVAKNDVMDRVWADSFVEEGNLTVYISTLRKALGENRGAHRYIITEPGRGYRFVADVRETFSDGLELVVEERAKAYVVIEESRETESEGRVLPITKVAVRRLYVKWAVITACVTLLVMVAAAAVWKLRPRPATHGVSLSLLQMTQLASWKMEPGEPATFPRFSHDGRMIAFSATKTGHSNIWIKQIISGEPIQVTSGDWTDRTPIWSPDNQQIAFSSNRGNQYGIWTTPALGGSLTLLKLIDSQYVELRHWSKDGRTLYYAIDHNLFALDLETRETTQVTGFDPLTAFSQDFSISPDEDRIAYADSQDGQFDIWVMPIQGGAPLRITNDSAEDAHPVWHPDGQRIIYSSNRGGAYQICVAYLDGREMEQMTSGDSDNLVPHVSPDGNSILYNSLKEESDLWSVKLDSGEQVEVTSDIGSEFWPDISPDGKSLLFQAGGGGEKLTSCSIRIKLTAAESQQVQIAADGFDPKWSPDGNRLAFLRLSDGRCNIWVINAAGGEASQLTQAGMTFAPYNMFPYNRTEIGGYSWSPDGSKIAYCSAKSGAGNIWIASADGSTDRKISNNTDPHLIYHRPLWSADGTRVVSILAPRVSFVDEHSTWQVWMSDLQNAAAIYSAQSHLRLIGWPPSGNTIILTSDENRELSARPKDLDLLKMSVGAGSEQFISQLKLAYPTNIKSSPNGNLIAFVSHQDGKDNVWMIPAIGGEAVKLTTNSDPRLYLSSLSWSPDSKAIYYGKQSKSSMVSKIDNFR
jgi:Tol biopolymer transport system component/DNA-binding winged helix-turn-helix (wHTH) protein